MTLCKFQFTYIGNLCKGRGELHAILENSLCRNYLENFLKFISQRACNFYLWKYSRIIYNEKEKNEKKNRTLILTTWLHLIAVVIAIALIIAYVIRSCAFTVIAPEHVSTATIACKCKRIAWNGERMRERERASERKRERKAGSVVERYCCRDRWKVQYLPLGNVSFLGIKVLNRKERYYLERIPKRILTHWTFVCNDRGIVTMMVDGY